MRRELNRLDLRKDDDPPGPQPEDYLRRIKAWLEDERTKARHSIDVELDNPRCVWVCWPLPPEYQVHAGPPDDEPQDQAARGECSPDQLAAAEDEEPEGSARQVILRIGVNDEFKLWVDFYPPDHEALDVELDLDVRMQLERRSVELYHRYLFDVMGCGEGFEVVGDLDIFEEDSAALIKKELSQFGIDLYCPVRSIGDALADKK
jgi:hypothetical protein